MSCGLRWGACKTSFYLYPKEERKMRNKELLLVPEPTLVVDEI
ncbi:hypothetical protein [Lysinibacillus sp. RS5]